MDFFSALGQFICVIALGAILMLLVLFVLWIVYRLEDAGTAARTAIKLDHDLRALRDDLAKGNYQPPKPTSETK